MVQQGKRLCQIKASEQQVVQEWKIFTMQHNRGF